MGVAGVPDRDELFYLRFDALTLGRCVGEASSVSVQVTIISSSVRSPQRIAFAASGYGLSTGHHFKVDLLAQRFPDMAAPLTVLSGILEAAFGLILLIAGSMQAYGALEQDMRSDTLLAVPLFWPMLAFPIGGFAILLQGIAHVLKPSHRS